LVKGVRTVPWSAEAQSTVAKNHDLVVTLELSFPQRIRATLVERSGHFHQFKYAKSRNCDKAHILLCAHLNGVKAGKRVLQELRNARKQVGKGL